MRLKRITLKNFRGFASLDLLLDEKLTVLVGTNGSGKSTALSAVSRVASCIAKDVFRDDRVPGFSIHDIRAGSANAELRTEWNQPEFSYVAQIGISRDKSAVVNCEVTDGALPQMPPLCIDYSTTRARSQYDYPPSISHARASISTQHPAWDDELNKSFLTFERLRQWFREREDYENQERVRLRKLDFTEPALDAVRRAARAILGNDFGPPRIERANGAEFVLKKGAHDLTADQMSEGERSLLIIASDLARRLFLSDPQALDPLQSEALVLLDEVELHLHPAWQRAIIRRLTETFPHVQFIVSTHSAIVLSEVQPKTVRILEGFQVFGTDEPVYGRDVNALLREILGGLERPEEVEEIVGGIARLIDANEVEKAKSETQKLERIVGIHDSEVIRLRTMLDFLERPLQHDDGA